MHDSLRLLLLCYVHMVNTAYAYSDLCCTYVSKYVESYSHFPADNLLYKAHSAQSGISLMMQPQYYGSG